jgi:putative intracellular protease/amidase
MIMKKKIAILVVNPVNGSGLFQCLEAFYENGVPFKTFAVGDSTQVKTNSGVVIQTDDVVANLKQQVAEYDAVLFACGDAMPKFAENVEKSYNQDMLAVLAEFDKENKILAGYCVAALLFDALSGCKGKYVAVHPMVKPMLKNCVDRDERIEAEGNLYTAQDETSVWMLLPDVLYALK